jgi:hypothetical protein
VTLDLKAHAAHRVFLVPLKVFLAKVAFLDGKGLEVY